MSRQTIGMLYLLGMFAFGWCLFALAFWYANRDEIRAERRRKEARKKPRPTSEEYREAFRRERKGAATGDRLAGVRYLNTRPSLQWTAEDWQREREREKRERQRELDDKMEAELERGRAVAREHDREEERHRRLTFPLGAQARLPG